MEQLTTTIGVASIDAGRKAGHLSEKYKFVDTKQLLSHAERAGWELNRVQSPRRGDASSPHLLIFRHPGIQPVDLGGLNGKSYVELLIQNSHDGSKAIRFMLGLFRMVCLNGAYRGLSMQEFRAGHTASGIKHLKEGFQFVADHAERELERVKQLSQFELTPDQSSVFLAGCLKKRLEFTKNVIDVSDIAPRREADKGLDAYTVFNRGQELMLRGGFQYVTQTTDENSQIIRQLHKARPVYAIQRSLDLNKFAAQQINSLVGVQ